MVLRVLLPERLWTVQVNQRLRQCGRNDCDMGRTWKHLTFNHEVLAGIGLEQAHHLGVVSAQGSVKTVAELPLSQ